jgi:hypothetical protein
LAAAQACFSGLWSTLRLEVAMRSRSARMQHRKAAAMITKTVERPEPMARAARAFIPNSDVLRLLVLREIEAAGPLTGLEAVNAVASTARLLGIAPPGFALLHDLTEGGLLQASAGMPRCYRLTDAGEREAEHLAQRCWPRLHEEMARFSRRLAPASPRGRPAISFVSEWTDEAIG